MPADPEPALSCLVQVETDEVFEEGLKSILFGARCLGPAHGGCEGLDADSRGRLGRPASVPPYGSIRKPRRKLCQQKRKQGLVWAVATPHPGAGQGCGQARRLCGCKPWHPATGGIVLRLCSTLCLRGSPVGPPSCSQQQPAHKFVSVDSVPSLVLVPGSFTVLPGITSHINCLDPEVESGTGF